MPPTALSGQMAHMRRTKPAIYKAVAEQPLVDVRRQYRVERDIIEDAAQELRIVLSLRLQGRPSVMPQPIPTPVQDDEQDFARSSRSSAPAHSERFTREDWSPSTVAATPVPNQPAVHIPIINTSSVNPINIRSFAFNNSETQLTSVFQGVYLPATPVNTSNARAASKDPLEDVRRSPKLMIEIDGEESQTRRHPTLLYRAFDPSHGFVARRFLQTDNIPDPPSVTSKEFNQDVSAHLDPDNRTNGPFLSFTQFPQVALKMIQKPGIAKSFAVFLFNDLDDEGSLRKKMKPRLVPQIVDDHELELKRDYNGRGEWLMYGRVDAQPLCILQTHEAHELHENLLLMDSCSLEAAIPLLPLLKNVDGEWRETLVRSLIKGYKVHGHKWNYHSPRWDEFAEVFYVHDEDEPPREPSRVPSIGNAAVSVTNPEPEKKSDEMEVDDESIGTSRPAVDPANNSNEGNNSRSMSTFMAQPREAASSPCPVERVPTKQPPRPSSPVFVDLTDLNDDDIGPTDGTAPLQKHASAATALHSIETQDVEMTDADTDDDLVVVSTTRRALSIRSRANTSVAIDTNTPTRGSRHPAQHIKMLEE